MRVTLNEVRNKVNLYTHKGNIHLNLGDGWCIMENTALKEILERVPLVKYHAYRCRFPRVKWEGSSDATT